MQIGDEYVVVVNGLTVPATKPGGEIKVVTLSRGTILTCIAQWIRSWRPIFAWDDPWPGVVKSSKYLLFQLFLNNGIQSE